MKRLFILSLIFLFLPYAAFCQKDYEPNWESLDSRPVASWFPDAKFGIFIHWGPYSVPSWSPKGTYEEWYLRWLTSQSIFGNGKFTGQEIPEFHKQTYGDNFNYIDFGKAWKAELYDPVKWAEIFMKSGAKYVIMTSKHHDGFALWPNKHASITRDYHWNSVETGPRRDLVGDFQLLKEGHSYVEGDYILKQTVDQVEGKAVKEIFFTRKDNDIYAIVPKFPKGKLVIKDFKPQKNTKVTLLGYESELTHTYDNGNLVIDVPLLSIDEVPCYHAWCFKISN